MSTTSRLARDPEKEARILMAALTEFSEHGYRKTHVEEIADQAEVSKGLVFKYYQSKENLYLTTLKSATQKFMAIADYNIWQDSEDLVAMVVNATRYKISLQLKFPREFKLLLNAFVQGSQLPKAIGDYVNTTFISNTDLQKKMLTPVLQRSKLKPGVSIDDVYEMIRWIENGYYGRIQEYLGTHPEITSIEDMNEIIEQLTKYFEIFEHGFMASN
ncbi:TetR/AcrR family transcriptional regulator [Lapidilactobacillus bayanensis]|uniref:TetR/AcrR family transcriptional regulator n=1 Tax=Lapidilactobacillus bayanensis TaxID=2485998 RepID=UPI000F78E657|nr:TetR/AcrR family transcriptional regulator [Lapidilactobacillus bayanensis]